MPELPYFYVRDTETTKKLVCIPICDDAAMFIEFKDVTVQEEDGKKKTGHLVIICEDEDSMEEFEKELLEGLQRVRRRKESKATLNDPLELKKAV